MKMKGIDKKLNNLIEFDDFDKTFKPKEQKSTKRTDVGLDILNEKWTSNDPEGRLREYVDGILEDLDNILKMNDIKQMKQSLSATYNMIINDSNYVFNQE